MKPFLQASSLLMALFGLGLAELERIEIRGREASGPFERLWGRAYFAVDPKLPVNQAVADLALAPKNSQGKIEFSSDLLVVRPRTGGKSRGTVFLEIVNRGVPQALGILSGARGGNPPERWDFGDQFLLQ